MVTRKFKEKRKIIFIVSTSSQAAMFGLIVRELPGSDILAISVNQELRKRIEIGKVLQKFDLPYEIIGTPSQRKAKEVIEELQPGVIIVGHDWELMERFFLSLAKSRGIPTLLVQDGVVAASDTHAQTSDRRSRFKYLFRSPFGLYRLLRRKDFSWRRKLQILWLELRYGAKGKTRIYGHGESSKTAVFGNKAKELMISEGVEPERIVITGNPKFDQVFHYKSLNCKQSICERWQIPLEQNIITLLTEPFVKFGWWQPEQGRKFLSTIAEAMALPNVKLIIKVHPAEFEEEYYEITEKLNPSPIVCKDIVLAELISASSLVVATVSTAVLEAMAMGKPVVIVNLFGDSWGSLYKESGAIYVNKEEDVLPAMKKALYAPVTRDETIKAMERFVYEEAYLQDGQAARRIADLILNMIANKNTCKA